MNDLLADVAAHVSRKADLPEYPGALVRAALEGWLATQLLGLLQGSQHERLLHLCYRTDLDEAAVKSAFELREPDAIAAEIAQLLVARELQKAETRRLYKKRFD